VGDTTYVKDSNLELPENLNTRVWRYMDFTKFVSMLKERSLYFTRPDSFEDTFEGSLSAPTIAAQESQNPKTPLFARNFGISILKEHFAAMRLQSAVNCWHVNDAESAAMWRLYLKSDEGIAIQSTVDRMIASFRDYLEDIHIGSVRYINYDSEQIPTNYELFPLLYKRASFRHEQELRAIIVRRAFLDSSEGQGKSLFRDPKRETFARGEHVPVSLGDLIERIYVSPTSPEWVRELVEAVARKYGITKPVVKSRLADSPLQ
jgi:hypothetical protein